MPAKVIQEHPLTGTKTALDLPVGAQLLGVGAVAGAIRLWVEADPAAKLEKRIFIAYTSREQIAEGDHFVGTVIRGPRVWHIYYEATIARPGRSRRAS